MNYENLMNLIASGESPSQVSDEIKSVLYAKSLERIEDIGPDIAASLFDSDE